MTNGRTQGDPTRTATGPRKPDAKSAILLTVLYWVVAAVFALLTPSAGWVDLRWVIAILLFAVPATLVLWLCWFALRYFQPAHAPRDFAAAGIAIPLVCVAVVWGGSELREKWHQQRLAEQIALASVDEMQVEPLRAAPGPIGLRLRYRIAYPKGLELDAGHGAAARVDSAQGQGFMLLRRTVTPAVAGAYAAGSYEVTEEFIPDFLPWSLILPEPRPAGTSRCFRWTFPDRREELLSSDAQAFTIAVRLQDNHLAQVTVRSYKLADFYETALKAGAVECPPPKR